MTGPDGGGRWTPRMRIRWERDEHGLGWWRVYCPDHGYIAGWPPIRVSVAHDYARLHTHTHTEVAA